MNITELITKLTAMRAEIGDVPVHDTNGFPVIGISTNKDEDLTAGSPVYCFIEAEF